MREKNEKLMINKKPCLCSGYIVWKGEDENKKDETVVQKYQRLNAEVKIEIKIVNERLPAIISGNLMFLLSNVICNPSFNQQSKYIFVVKFQHFK